MTTVTDRQTDGAEWTDRRPVIAIPRFALMYAYIMR